MKTPGSAFVYFIQACPPDGDIKIGTSRNPETRLLSIQTHCPNDVKILGVIPGGIGEEHRLHEKFKSTRKRGEWFSMSPELMEFIATNAKPIKEARASVDVSHRKLKIGPRSTHHDSVVQREIDELMEGYFNPRRTPLHMSPETKTVVYRNAVEAIGLAMKRGGLDAGIRACASALHDELLGEYEARTKSKMSKDHACINRLVGRKCDYYSCVGAPASDHVDLFKRSKKAHRYTSHPYGINFRDLCRIVEFCKANGLEANINAESYYFPGRTVMLEYKRAGEKEE